MSDPVPGWITPTVTESHGVAIVTRPTALAGRVVVGGLDARACGRQGPDAYTACGLVEAHLGDHWVCAIEFINQAGPFVLRTSVVDALTSDLRRTP